MDLTQDPLKKIAWKHQEHLSIDLVVNDTKDNIELHQLQ